MVELQTATQLQFEVALGVLDRQAFVVEGDHGCRRCFRGSLFLLQFEFAFEDAHALQQVRQFGGVIGMGAGCADGEHQGEGQSIADRHVASRLSGSATSGCPVGVVRAWDQTRTFSVLVICTMRD